MGVNERNKNIELTWRTLRDPLTWLLGAGLLIYEVVARHGQDEAVLATSVGLLGLPAFVRADQRRKERSSR